VVGPDIPEHINGNALDKAIWEELRSLGSRADLVARHLVAAWELLEDDPDVAVEHALAASAAGARLAVVREAAGEVCYAAGRFDKALVELKAARRMSGSDDMLAVIADCERGVGRPKKALDLAASPAAARLAPEQRVEMLIVAAGARADQGRIDDALSELDVPALHRAKGSGPVARLRYAYADLLERAGRLDEAREWFAQASMIDVEGDTDADERALELSRRLDEDRDN
jgi:tetratricopeptide (TPR) repeat protein